MGTEAGRDVASTVTNSARKELLRVFKRTTDPVLTAPEVAEELDITQQAAHKKLQAAHKEGEIRRKKVGASAVVWWTDESCPDYVSDSA
ncbi:ArsR family transcriptional regulator [Halobellus sp. Atlit-38R]|uniref:helix-turn-helix transcriptional regulator n=1 Tax=Halobellus sp. Atlit-38R TaxID=2282131 RepID=UPI000EF26197|nr:helix-turn-helix transcriptional regulator [Halobellus sp. Atlit-38R]RLM88664.1 ArsR family transcriptional regulator [Halobellus sp. Atlit-38R]